MHGRKVGTTVQASKVGGGACIALTVGWGLGVGHRVGSGALHAGGGGDRQGVWQWGDGGWAPDGHCRASRAGAGGDGCAWRRRWRTVGSVGGVGTGFSVGLTSRGCLLFRGPWFGLARALLLLLAALGTAVLEPDLEDESRASKRRLIMKC